MGAPPTARVELDGQYRLLREEAGIVRRNRGVLAVTGSQAAEYLQGQVTNDVLALADGEGCYAALLDRKGHLRADLRVLRVAADELLLDADAAGFDALRTHLTTYLVGFDARVEDRSRQCAVVSVIGPAATAIVELPKGAEHAHAPAEIDGGACRAIRTPDGVDLICDTGDVERVISAIEAAEVDEAAAEIIRVESGRPRLGFEMGPDAMPQEAGINERAVSFSKGCYIGQETVARLHYRGKPNRHLRGLRLSGPAESGDALSLGDRDVGRIGTACLSPALGHVGLAIIRREAEPGSTLTVAGGTTTATVVELPFGTDG